MRLFVVILKIMLIVLTIAVVLAGYLIVTQYFLPDTRGNTAVKDTAPLSKKDVLMPSPAGEWNYLIKLNSATQPAWEYELDAGSRIEAVAGGVVHNVEKNTLMVLTADGKWIHVYTFPDVGPDYFQDFQAGGRIVRAQTIFKGMEKKARFQFLVMDLREGCIFSPTVNCQYVSPSIYFSALPLISY